MGDPYCTQPTYQPKLHFVIFGTALLQYYKGINLLNKDNFLSFLLKYISDSDLV
jgi:hypothetical protein